jgi:hypothetical protein
MIVFIKKRLERKLPAFKAKVVGIRLYPAPRSYLGIGDSIQFSSLPENYFRNHGQCLIDIDRHWIFDHNPYVIRCENAMEVCDEIVDLWQDCDKLKKNVRKRRNSPSVFTTNAEAQLSIMGGGRVFLNRPRLYVHENFPYEKRKLIILHAEGRSNGRMPDYLIDHIIKKYGGTGNLMQIAGPKDQIIPQIPSLRPSSIWESVKLISQCSLFIGVDSGPAWIAACYPDVRIKKVRLTEPWGVVGNWRDWVPLEVRHPQSHWDDTTLFELFNLQDFDDGVFRTWKKI